MMESSKLDVVKWSLVAFLASVGLVANYHYDSSVIWSIRVAAGLLLSSVLLGVIATTALGKRLWCYVTDARIELRKVVWPTRDAVVQVSSSVIVMVLSVVVILWVVDNFLMWLVSFLVN